MVSMDQEKIEVILNWPHQKSLKASRGFLGMSGYYHKFIKNCGLIAEPLTALLKKGAFVWSPSAEKVQAPILVMPNFSKEFVVECDDLLLEWVLFCFKTHNQ